MTGFITWKAFGHGRPTTILRSVSRLSEMVNSICHAKENVTHTVDMSRLRDSASCSPAGPLGFRSLGYRYKSGGTKFALSHIRTTRRTPSRLLVQDRICRQTVGMNSVTRDQEGKEFKILNNDERVESQKKEDIERQRSAAAQTVQKNYRGYRARRELRGLSLDPSSRWMEVSMVFHHLRLYLSHQLQAIKEAQYRDLTTPRSKSSRPNELTRTKSEARANWSRVGRIARRAGGSEDSSLSPSSDSNEDRSHASHKEAKRRKRLAEQQERNRSAKQMDLSYFLEMVDVKHRYGSNLRKYHAEWQNRPTTENFFYWLDYGEGKEVEVEKCSRERLEKMQVRYLGREERRLYEVIVDKDGKLCWRKDGVRVDTTDQWRDSVKGIVRIGDPAPEWAHDRPAMLRGSSESSGMSSEEITPSPATSPPASPIDEHEELGSIDRVLKEPKSPKPTAARNFLGNVFRRPTEAKDNKKDKRKKQIWIFVSFTRQ